MNTQKYAVVDGEGMTMPTKTKMTTSKPVQHQSSVFKATPSSAIRSMVQNNHQGHQEMSYAQRTNIPSKMVLSRGKFHDYTV